MQRMTAATEQSEEENKPLPLAFDPDRVCTPEQLVTLNLLSTPIWIFDYVERRSKFFSLQDWTSVL